jgi:siroheme synthase (precorrin-2 oxidase/ferrochelatase)
MSDSDVLALAAVQRRVLVSHDVGTMPSHFRAFKEAGKHSAGVFLVSQSLDVGAAIDDLLLIWLATEASEWEDRIVWLPL